MRDKLIALGLIAIFLLSSTTVYAGFKINKQNEDFDPLDDVEITVEIQKIRSHEKSDRQIFFKEYIDKNTAPDFYVKVFINDVEFQSETWSNTKYIHEPDWSATLNVPDDVETVDVKIQLWDEKDENIKEDRLCDLNGERDKYDVELTYNIKTGHWTGDDFLDLNHEEFDPSGYGRLNGCDDGTIYEKDMDCELWFDIYQNDFDNDGIPYWTEVNILGTDPEIDDSEIDSDSDGIPNYWEWKWGYDPLTIENHNMLDPDEDSINNYEEYLTCEWYSDPFRKDVFVELDIMEEGPNGEKSYMPDESKELIATAFNRRNIMFHLDDGQMGGSDIIPFKDKLDYSEIRDIYETYFIRDESDNWRRGIFHYGLVVYSTQGAAGFMFRSNAFQVSTLGHEYKSENPILDRDEVYASAYMHELGHTFSFWPIPGHDKLSMHPWQLGWWINRPYKSCMNYGYMYYTVDYSDGSRASPIDLNDWERMSYTSFERDW